MNEVGSACAHFPLECPCVHASSPLQTIGMNTSVPDLYANLNCTLYHIDAFPEVDTILSETQTLQNIVNDINSRCVLVAVSLSPIRLSC